MNGHVRYKQSNKEFLNFYFQAKKDITMKKLMESKKTAPSSVCFPLCFCSNKKQLHTWLGLDCWRPDSTK